MLQIPLNDSKTIQGIQVTNVEYLSVGILYNPVTKMMVLAAGESSYIWTVSLDGKTAKLMTNAGKCMLLCFAKK